MVGLIGKKLGMTQVFGPNGELIPVTVVKTGPCTVVQIKTPESDGYGAVQLGFGEQKQQRVSKAYRQHCLRAGRVFDVLQEFEAPTAEGVSVGQEFSVADLFKAGDTVDVSGTSKGRGYSGVIRRHGFSGFPGSHGTHEYFRHGGSIGNRSYPGRVFKGRRMAGQYGNERITTQNLVVVDVRPEENLLLIRGAVPGATGGTVTVSRAAKGGRNG